MTGGQYKSRLRLLQYNAAKAAALQAAPTLEQEVAEKADDPTPQEEVAEVADNPISQQEVAEAADEHIFSNAIQEQIMRASIISKEHEHASWFWRGGFWDEVDYSSWYEEGPSPVTSPPSRAQSPGIVTAVPKPRRTAKLPLAGRGLKVLRALQPQWSDRDQAVAICTFFDEAARRGGMDKSELFLQIRLNAHRGHK